MLGKLANPFVKIGVAAMLAMLISGSFYAKGRMDGKAIAKAAALEETIKALKGRNDIDALVDKKDDAGLCAALGGVFTNGKCE